MRRLRTCRLIPYLFGGRLLCDGFPLIFSGNAGNPLHTVELPQYADKGIHRHLQPSVRADTDTEATLPAGIF